MRVLLAALMSVLVPLTTFAGQFSPIESTLQSHVEVDGQIVIEFCQLDRCEALGRREGYSTSEWVEIQGICRSEGRFGGLKSMWRQALAFGFAAAAAGPTAGVVAASAIEHLAKGAPQRSYVAAGELLPGLLSEGEYLVSLHDFVALIDGIRTCAGEWNRRSLRRYLRLALAARAVMKLA